MKEMLTRPGTFPILLDEPAMVGIPCISGLIDLLNNPVFTNLPMKECFNRKYSEPQTKPLSLPLPVFQTPFLCSGLHKAILVIPCVFNSLWFFCGPSNTWQGIKCDPIHQIRINFSTPKEIRQRRTRRTARSTVAVRALDTESNDHIPLKLSLLAVLSIKGPESILNSQLSTRQWPPWPRICATSETDDS